MADKDQNQNLEDTPSLGEDLEEYGVWVKAGPEDVDENEGESLFGLSDLDEEAAEDSFADETTLTNEEEDLLADLEESNPEEEGTDSLESLDLEDDDLSFEGLDLPEPSVEDDLSDLSVDSGADDDDFSLDLSEDEVEVEIDSGETSEDGIEEMSIESLDTLMEDEGLDMASIPSGEQDEFEDIVVEDDDEPTATEELPELEFEDEQPTLEAETSFEEIELEEPSFEGESLEEESIELGGEPLPSPESLEEDFDDISAVEASMTSPVSSPASSKFGEPSEADGRVLATIEEELASIKSELHQLRAELASFRSGEIPSPEPQPVETAEEASDETGPGFFDEDEDETIALTGDELDNILKTSEFTEETGKPSDYEDFDLSTDFGDSDILGEGEDLIPEGMEMAEPSDLEEEGIETAPVDLDLGGTEELPMDESPIEEITLEDIESETGASEELTLGSEDIPAVELPDEELLGGDDDEVAALAEMDIETELAGIDELKDEPEGEEMVVEEKAPEQPSDVEEESIEIDLSGLDEGSLGEPEELMEDDLDMGPEGSTKEADEDLGALEMETEPEPAAPSAATTEGGKALPADLEGEIRSVLTYMDQLLEALPDDKIQEFARSEHFEVYKRLFEELGLEQQ